MGYLDGRRGEMRADPRTLLPAARSVICVGKLYNGPQPYSVDCHSDKLVCDARRTDEHGLGKASPAGSTRRKPADWLAWISRYAWGDDYHDVLRGGLRRLVEKLTALAGSFEWRICVDTAPLLERSYARRAGLGWIGRNTCLINEHAGSWFFLGELLVSLDLDPGAPPPDRCGSCTRCIDACPTAAIVPAGGGGPEFELDSRRCISYFTIELRGSVPENLRPFAGNNVFGCDICQDVCPWNGRAAMTLEPSFAAKNLSARSRGRLGADRPDAEQGDSASLFAPPLELLAALTEDEFRGIFRETPVTRAKYSGFLRNVAIAMGASGRPEFRAPLERLSVHPDPLVAEHAFWALARIGRE